MRWAHTERATYCYIVHCGRFVQLFDALNLQLDCSIESMQKTVLVILTNCVIVYDVYFIFLFLFVVIHFHCYVSTLPTLANKRI